jgi:collagen type IV alpha
MTPADDQWSPRDAAAHQGFPPHGAFAVPKVEDMHARGDHGERPSLTLAPPGAPPPQDRLGYSPHLAAPGMLQYPGPPYRLQPHAAGESPRSAHPYAGAPGAQPFFPGHPGHPGHAGHHSGPPTPGTSGGPPDAHANGGPVQGYFVPGQNGAGHGHGAHPSHMLQGQPGAPPPGARGMPQGMPQYAHQGGHPGFDQRVMPPPPPPGHANGNGNGHGHYVQNGLQNSLVEPASW